MKMLNNVLEADVFATSRTPIQSPRSTKMGEGDLPYVHPNVQPKSTKTTTPRTGPWPWPSTWTRSTPVNKKDIKTASFLPPSQMCGRCPNAMAPRRKRKRRTTRRRPRRVTYSQVGGVGVGLPVGILKAGYGITKAIGDHQTKRAIEIGEKRRREVASGKRKRYAGESFNCSIM